MDSLANIYAKYDTNTLANHGSDKGTVHRYIDIYERCFALLRESATDILELGIGSLEQTPSLKMWREYFPLATIHGIDRGEVRSTDLERIKTYQLDINGGIDQWIRDTFKWFQFDIIIDDASHAVYHQLIAFHYFWPTLKPGGLYCVEDIMFETYLEYWKPIKNVSTFCMNRSSHHRGSILLIVRKDDNI